MERKILRLLAMSKKLDKEMQCETNLKLEDD